MTGPTYPRAIVALASMLVAWPLFAVAQRRPGLRNGRYERWDVGGVWYFYSEPIEGPPDDVEAVGEATTASPPPTPSKEPRS